MQCDWPFAKVWALITDWPIIAPPIRVRQLSGSHALASDFLWSGFVDFEIVVVKYCVIVKLVSLRGWKDVYVSKTFFSFKYNVYNTSAVSHSGVTIVGDRASRKVNNLI